MGTGGRQSVESRGRPWRRAAGATSFRFGPRLEGDAVAAPSPPPEPQGDGSPPLRAPWALRTAATLRPGQKGTKHLLAEYGERLVAVRYREDPLARKRYKTAEIIVAETDWAPPPAPDDLVQVRVAWEEEDLRAKVKQAGGRWRPRTKTWELPYRDVVTLGLEDRLAAEPGL